MNRICVKCSKRYKTMRGIKICPKCFLTVPSLFCDKHHRILIGKSRCVDCEKLLNKQDKSTCVRGSDDVRIMTKDKLRELKKWLTKGYGKRCKDFYYGCFVCQIWMAYDILVDAFEIELK